MLQRLAVMALCDARERVAVSHDVPAGPFDSRVRSGAGRRFGFRDVVRRKVAAPSALRPLCFASARLASATRAASAVCLGGFGGFGFLGCLRFLLFRSGALGISCGLDVFGLLELGSPFCLGGLLSVICAFGLCRLLGFIGSLGLCQALCVLGLGCLDGRLCIGSLASACLASSARLACAAFLASSAAFCFCHSLRIRGLGGFYRRLRLGSPLRARPPALLPARPWHLRPSWPRQHFCCLARCLGSISLLRGLRFGWRIGRLARLRGLLGLIGFRRPFRLLRIWSRAFGLGATRFRQLALLVILLRLGRLGSGGLRLRESARSALGGRLSLRSGRLLPSAAPT